MYTEAKPAFEKTRNLVFSVRKKLNQVFLGQLLEVRANTRPDFPVLTFENNQDPDFIHKDEIFNIKRLEHKLFSHDGEFPRGRVTLLREGQVKIDPARNHFPVKVAPVPNGTAAIHIPV